MAQRLYLLLSAVLMAIVSQSTLATFIAGQDGQPYELTCWKLYATATGETMSGAPWALMVLAIGIALVSLFGLFLVFYQNYALQKRVTIFNTLLVVGFLLTYAGFFFYYRGALEAVSGEPSWWAVAVPVVVLILQLMSFLAIRQKEAKVLAEATTFRLRD